MTTKIQRWGNSLALRIPKSYVSDAHLAKGMTVEIAVKRGQLVIKPSKSVRHTLSSLLKDVSAANLHGEVSTGKSVGREAW